MEKRTKLPHCGELHYELELNDLPSMSFRHYVSGTAVSPDGCHIALGVQDGNILVVHRRTPEAGEFSWCWTVPTGICYPGLLVLAEDASFLMVLGNDDTIRIFSRHINEWTEERVFDRRIPELGLYREHHGITLDAKALRIARKRDGEVLYCYRRWRRWWRKGHYWVRVPVPIGVAKA